MGTKKPAAATTSWEDMSFSTQQKELKKAVENSRRWQRALGLNDNEAQNALMMRMSFEYLKARKLMELKDHKEGLERACEYPATAAAEMATREVMTNYYRHIGTRMAFGLRAELDGTSDDRIRAALDRAEKIGVVVREHIRSHPLDAETAAELAELTQRIAHITSLPDDGEWEEDQDDGHKTNEG